jgi:hypothetical protein
MNTFLNKLLFQLLNTFNGDKMKYDDTKILTLKGVACGSHSPSFEFEDKGTMQTFRNNLWNKPFEKEIIFVQDGVNQVSTDYSAKVGEYLFNTLHYEDISDVIGTLEGVNYWLRDTGNVAHEYKWDKYFCMYSAIESEVFKKAPKSDRINLIVSLDKELTDESVRYTSKHYLGSKFLDNNFRLMYGVWHGKYLTLEKDVTDIWNREVCEKVVFPCLEKQL